MFRSLPLLLATALLTAGCSADINVIHVAPDGLPDAPGTALAPLASVQAALDRAGPGDTVRLRPGIYRERVSFKTGGLHNAPVTLEGEPGAILDGGHIATLDWQPAPDIGPGVWRTALDQPTRVVVADGRSLAMLRDDWVRVGSARAGPDWEYPRLLNEGAGPGGLTALGGVALYRFRERELLVRFHKDLDPRTMDIAIGPDANQPIIDITDVDRVVVRGLTLRNASAGVRIRHSLGAVVENCVIGPIEEGVRLLAGADRATIRFNEIHWSPLGENHPKAPHASEFWNAHKRAGWSDKRAIYLSGSAGGHRIHDNHIHHHWDGISVMAGDPEHDGGLRIHHNRISTLVDDGIETNGAQVDCHWHDNLIEDVQCAARLKAPDHGPFYVYRNIFLNNREDIRNFGAKDNRHRRDPKTGEWIVIPLDRGSPVVLPAVAYIYHNTSTARAAVVSNKVYGIGVPNYHYFNNLFWSETWFAAVPRANPSIDPNWKGDHNVFIRRGESPRWADDEARAHALGIDLNSLFAETDPGFADPASGDVSLLADSPARHRGANLAGRFEHALPGLPPGESPDAGALQYGEPMPVIPRPRSAVRDLPPSGSWPGPDATRIQLLNTEGDIE